MFKETDPNRDSVVLLCKQQSASTNKKSFPSLCISAKVGSMSMDRIHPWPRQQMWKSLNLLIIHIQVMYSSFNISCKTQCSVRLYSIFIQSKKLKGSVFFSNFSNSNKSQQDENNAGYFIGITLTI